MADAVSSTTATTTTSTATSSSSSTTASSASTISSDFETFLTMLSAQLENQDPMNPVDSTDYAVQLATFSSVEQQVLTNNLLAEMISQYSSSGMSGLSSWVGMEARSVAPAYYDGEPVSVAIDPLTAADSAYMVVYNDDGTEVYREQVALTGGTVEWDGSSTSGGSVAVGLYTFELENYSDGELLSADTAESYSLITEARMVSGETVLVTEGGDLVTADAISGLRNPAST